MAGHLSSIRCPAQQKKEGAGGGGGGGVGKVATYCDGSSKLTAADRLGCQRQILLPNGLSQSRGEHVMEHVMDKGLHWWARVALTASIGAFVSINAGNK